MVHDFEPAVETEKCWVAFLWNHINSALSRSYDSQWL